MTESDQWSRINYIYIYKFVSLVLSIEHGGLPSQRAIVLLFIYLVSKFQVSQSLKLKELNSTSVLEFHYLKSRSREMVIEEYGIQNRMAIAPNLGVISFGSF